MTKKKESSTHWLTKKTNKSLTSLPPYSQSSKCMKMNWNLFDHKETLSEKISKSCNPTIGTWRKSFNKSFKTRTKSWKTWNMTTKKKSKKLKTLRAELERPKSKLSSLERRMITWISLINLWLNNSGLRKGSLKLCN